MFIGDQPSFSVVSKGADCLLINKQFYQEHASEKLLREVRQNVSLLQKHSVQYLEFSDAIKIKPKKNQLEFHSFLVFAENIDCGYTLEPLEQKQGIPLFIPV